ncbi:MAG: Do family serine endopeptidase [Thermotogota bacterium]
MKKLLVVLAVFIFSLNVFAAVNADVESPFVKVVDEAGPAVVSIEATGEQSATNMDPYFEDFFRRFFGEIPQQNREFQSLGTGFIFDKEGYIITNYHVVDKASNIRVTMSDDKSYEAEYIGGDSDLDLAILKIESEEDLPIVELGDSDKLKIGQWSIAIGNPLGFSHTITTGVVSAFNRRIQKPDGSGYYVDLIQTDAAINPGNSGGPLLDIHGRVIGINTVIVNPSQGVNLGFAIPINLAKRFAYSLIEDGSYERAYLGVYYGDVNESLQKALGLKVDKGAYINDVVDNSAADKAGIQAGDVIIKVGNNDIEDGAELSSVLKTYQAGKEVVITVNRNGETLEIDVVLGKAEEVAQESSENYFGIKVRNLKPNDYEEFDLSKDIEGIFIEEVLNQNYIYGVKQGDVISQIAINGEYHNLENVQDWEEIASSIEKNSYVALIIHRQNIRYVVKFFYK